jgi:hypothetical protein
MTLRSLPFLALLGLVAFLSVRPSPFMAGVPFFPDWLAAWADGAEHAPHTLAFAVLGIVGFWARYPARLAWPSLQAIPAFLINVPLLMAMAILLEVPQLWIETRAFNWADIYAAWVGLGIAAAVLLGLSMLKAWLAWRLRPRYSILNP